MVLSGRRSLSYQTLQKLKHFLKLKAREFHHLTLLWKLAESDDPQLRRQTLQSIQKSAKQHGVVSPVLNAYQYLTRWYFVAIRELANQPGFVTEPRWIKEQLQFPVTLKEVSKALSFLLKESYLKENEDGSTVPTKKKMECLGGVYRIALGDFHRQMLKLSETSIDSVPSSERLILGHTLSLSESDYVRVCDLLRKLISDVSEVESAGQENDRVYHVALAAVPLTKKPKKKG